MTTNEIKELIEIMFTFALSRFSKLLLETMTQNKEMTTNWLYFKISKNRETC